MQGKGDPILTPRRAPMSLRHTGFHPSDPDWTEGRGIAIREANAQARKDTFVMRRATYTKETTDA